MGKIDLTQIGQEDAQAALAPVVEAPKPKPKEYVDMSDLTGVLKSVLDYKFREG